MMYVVTADDYECGALSGHVVVGVFRTLKKADEVVDVLKRSAGKRTHLWEIDGFSRGSTELIDPPEDAVAEG